MYIGQPSGGKDFFKLLMESEEFCSELGQATLSAGKLEVELMLLLKRKNVISEIGQHTLGTLIKKAKDEGILDNNLIISLETTTKQRNYLIHNIYALLMDIIDETILERKDLIDSDVITYTERAITLKENLNHMAYVVSRL